MSLADHVRTLGRGPGRSRSLTFEEAHHAMTLMLSGQAAPEAVGALLMLLRMKGETAAEIAGFAAAAQAALPPLPQADLDWPSYAAGRTRGQPWFLLSAKLVALAGHRVLLHGWNGSDPNVRAGLADARISVARDIEEAARLLDRDRITYLRLESLHPALFALLNLRDVFGLRSCVNTVCRMLNPARARASVQGVFHPSYRQLQVEAAAMLAWDNLTVIKGGGGEFERYAAKETAGFGLRAGAPWEKVSPARIEKPPEPTGDGAAMLGSVSRAGSIPPFETEVVLGTAEMALDTLGHTDPSATAASLWVARNNRHAA